MKPEQIGFPSWPPTSTPQDTISFSDLPRFNVTLRPRSSLEVSGLPTSGKTQIILALEKILPIHYIREPYISTSDKTAEMLLPPALVGDDDIGSVPLFKDKIDKYNFQIFKNLWLLALPRDDHSKTPTVFERGPFDTLVWWYALWSYTGKDRGFKVPAVLKAPQIIETLKPHVESTVNLLPLVSTVVLVDIDQVAAKKRSPHGHVTRSDFFPHLAKWYSYLGEWLGNDKNWLKYGFGVLTLDGRLPPPKNAEILSAYLQATRPQQTIE